MSTHVRAVACTTNWFAHAQLVYSYEWIRNELLCCMQNRSSFDDMNNGDSFFSVMMVNSNTNPSETLQFSRTQQETLLRNIV